MPIKKTLSPKTKKTTQVDISGTSATGSRRSLITSLSYITIIGWFVAYLADAGNKTEHHIFHIRQSFGVHMSMLAMEVLGTFSMIPYVFTNIAWVVYGITMIIMLIQSLRGKQSSLPFLGSKFQSWFSFL